MTITGREFLAVMLVWGFCCAASGAAIALRIAGAV